MSSNFSRRSFLGGFLAAVAACLGRKMPDAAAAPPPPATPAVPPPPLPYAASAPLGSVTTYVYDAYDHRMSVNDALSTITTYS
jgi:YD repeat-containing protein